MRTVEQALEALAPFVAAGARAPERVPLADALGRVLAEDVQMDHDVPPFRRATMDGFAVHATDAATGPALHVGAAVHAGDVPDQALEPGHAQRVMTGAPVPDGTALVVPFEWCEDRGDAVVLQRLPDEGTTFIVERGAHVAQGELVLPAGTLVDPGAVGVLATAGIARVAVRPPLRVAILPTGNELVEPQDRPGPGHIRNSNASVLYALVRRAGAVPLDLGITRDDPASLDEAIARALDDGVDVLLVTGGVSKGDRDYVPAALEARGVTCLFHGWSVQPGGPMWCGHAGEQIVFGLPGNPAGVFVGFEMLVVPVLQALAGAPLHPRTAWRVPFEGPWGRAGGRRRFRPVTLSAREDRTLVARAVPWKGSGDPFAWAGVDALAVLPEHVSEPPAEGIDVIPLGPSRP